MLKYPNPVFQPNQEIVLNIDLLRNNSPKIGSKQLIGLFANEWLITVWKLLYKYEDIYLFIKNYNGKQFRVEGDSYLPQYNDKNFYLRYNIVLDKTFEMSVCKFLVDKNYVRHIFFCVFREYYNPSFPFMDRKEFLFKRMVEQI